MKYIEELVGGDSFLHNNKMFVLTSDFKSNGQRMAINFETGFPVWMNAQDMVECVPLFRLDSDNNIIPIKHVAAQNQSLS